MIPAAASTGPEPSKSTGKEPSKSKVKTITVADDYFSLTRLTVKKGQKIKWVWSRQNFDSHNVTLVSGPKGVSHQKFHVGHRRVRGQVRAHLAEAREVPLSVHYPPGIDEHHLDSEEVTQP